MNQITSISNGNAGNPALNADQLEDIQQLLASYNPSESRLEWNEWLDVTKEPAISYFTPIILQNPATVLHDYNSDS